MFQVPTARSGAPIAVKPAPPATLGETIPLRLPARRLTILKIAPTSFFADYGCHVRIYEETRVLQDRGHRVVICTYHTGGDVPGLDIRRTMNTPFLKSVRVGSSRRKPYYDALLLAKSAAVAMQIRPHVVHAHLHEGALIGAPIARLLGIPLIFDFQGSLTSEMIDHSFLRRESRLYRPLHWLERRIDHVADRIVTSSRNAANVLIDEYGYPRDRVVTIADRVNTLDFRPAGEQDRTALARRRAELGIPSDRPVVVYLGLLAEYQGIGTLLKAAAMLLLARRLPVHFLVMGWPAVDSYRAVADFLGIADHVTFTGRVPYRDAPLHLALGDVAVSPKVSETEGNGKLLNYMAVGLPTVAFNTPVAREILGDLGLYADLGSAESLAERIAQLLEHPDQARVRGAQLRARAVERFQWAAAAEALESVYRLAATPALA